MTEHPKLLRGDMVRAVLAGTKTQTRVPVKPQPSDRADNVLRAADGSGDVKFLVGNVHYPRVSTGNTPWIKCPFGDLRDDYLWIRETWKADTPRNNQVGIRYRADGKFIPIEVNHAAWHRWYLADGYHKTPLWRPSIHMPRWACRLRVKVLRTWVERIQDISEDDAKAEGVCEPICDCGECIDNTYRGMFQDLWNSIYEKDGFGWGANPWVFGAEFEMEGDE